MNGSNTSKLLDAGFRVFRLNVIDKKITECKGFGRWVKTASYRNKAELMRAWNMLMKNPKHIGD